MPLTFGSWDSDGDPAFFHLEYADDQSGATLSVMLPGIEGTYELAADRSLGTEEQIQPAA